MARSRNIKPALFKNELLGVADPLLTLLFQSLWTLADKEGRLEDRPLRIKAETFPYRDGLDINGYLTELQRLGFIVRYTVGLDALIQVVNFKKHQTPHNTEKPSELPPVEAGTITGGLFQAASVKSPLSNGENVNALPPDSLVLIPSTLIPDSPIHKKHSAEYSAEFELAWAAYPKREGASKKDAFKAWSARIKNGILPSVMIEGAKRYAAYCRAQGTEQQYIKQPVTFFGTGEHYLASWVAVPSLRRGTPPPENFAQRDYGTGVQDL